MTVNILWKNNDYMLFIVTEPTIIEQASVMIIRPILGSWDSKGMIMKGHLQFLNIIQVPRSHKSYITRQS